MKDFPIFPTEYGVASLILKEIPYRREAYIRVRDAQADCLEPLLGECAAFCRMAGAERVYAAGHEALEGHPLYTIVYEMAGEAKADPEKVERLFPVTEKTVSRWREAYNKAMTRVDNAGTLEARDEARILAGGGAYFIHREGTPLGIGWLEGERLLAVAALEPGMGERVMHTLMSLIEDRRMTLEVASTNERAIGLYEKLGFLKIREITRWYRV